MPTVARCVHSRTVVVIAAEGGTNMGKYFIAWVLGVPATVLVIVYLIWH
jgi:hypothetical protein